MAMDPLHGWTPRRVDANQVMKALNGDINPFTKRPFSHAYKQTLERRKKLPVFKRISEFYRMHNASQMMVVETDPTAGTTTQIPQLVAYSDLPHRKGKMVACTQPPYFDILSTARHVAGEMDVEIGKEVGYSTKFEDFTEPGNTFLKYTTDEALLFEVIGDRTLSRYSSIILDEAQERTIGTDFLLATLKAICKERPDLKIIVISASPDSQKFQKYLGTRNVPVPLLKAPGDIHPVEILYTQEPEPDYIEAAIRTVLFLHQGEGPGDILVFLANQEEVEDACRKIRIESDELIRTDSSIGPLLCVPLHSSLSPQKRQKVFDPAPPATKPGGTPGRKVVVSTHNMGTAIVIQGIVYVVDSGMEEQTVYNPRIRVVSELSSFISKSAAGRRADCARRTRPGKCFRLYTEKHYTKEMEHHTTPELLRSKLSGTILAAIKWGVTDLVRFDWVDPPFVEVIMRALELLNYLGALDDDGNLTALGSVMAEFPIEPRLSKMLITSVEFNCTNEILAIISMLLVPSIFLRPPNQRKEADAAKSLLSIPEGDHLTLMNVYNSYVTNKHDPNWASRNYLSAEALAKVDVIRNQLMRTMERLDINLTSISISEPSSFQAIRKALVCGLFTQVAHKQGAGYKTVKDNQSVSIHPTSVLNEYPEWVVFSEWVLTTRSFIRNVTAIQPEWLFELGGAYYDLKELPAGETKNALMKLSRKRPQLAQGQRNDTAEHKKRRKKDSSHTQSQKNNATSSKRKKRRNKGFSHTHGGNA